MWARIGGVKSMITYLVTVHYVNGPTMFCVEASDHVAVYDEVVKVIGDRDYYWFEVEQF
jgi:hypothetical protein